MSGPDACSGPRRCRGAYDNRCSRVPLPRHPLGVRRPYAERLQEIDERVWLPSVTESARTLALVIGNWCGLG